MYDIDLSKIIQTIKRLNVDNKKLIFVGKDFGLIKEEISSQFDYIEEYSNDYNAKDILAYAKWFLQSGNKIASPKPSYLRKSEAELSLLKSSLS